MSCSYLHRVLQSPAWWRFHAFLPVRQHASRVLSLDPTAGDRAFRTACGGASCRMLGSRV